MYLFEEVSLFKSLIQIIEIVVEISMVGDPSSYSTGCSKCKPDNLLQK